MGRLSLLSVGLFVLPIAITIGVLVGYETYQLSRGQKGLAPQPLTGVSVSTYCQKAFGVHPDASQYIFNPNQWGTDVVTNGSSLCLNVTEFNNQTYDSDITAPPFTATWLYPPGPETEPVHAYPNAKLDLPGTIPVQINNVANLDVKMRWTYGVGTEVAESTDGTTLDAVSLNANVCIDMFLDPEEDHAGITNVSAYEVMIWFGRYGPSTQPIGNLLGIQSTQTAGGVNFDLFYGSNSIGQKVFTWVAEGNTTEFSGDVQILIDSLSGFGGPAETDYLGYMAFGSECLYSFAQMTFSVPSLSLGLTTKS